MNDTLQILLEAEKQFEEYQQIAEIVEIAALTSLLDQEPVAECVIDYSTQITIS